MLKKAGRGHEPGGVDGTQPGELCTRCPACPRPGYNIPDNWETVSDELKWVVRLNCVVTFTYFHGRYLYMQFIAIDANFRLKRRAISTYERDPALGSGWGFFVEGPPYREYVLQHADQEDVREFHPAAPTQKALYVYRSARARASVLSSMQTSITAGRVT